MSDFRPIIWFDLAARNRVFAYHPELAVRFRRVVSRFPALANVIPHVERGKARTLLAGIQSDRSNVSENFLQGWRGECLLADSRIMSQKLRGISKISGRKVFTNRVGWARTYLKKAGLLDPPKRGFQQITQRGRTVLAESPERIDDKFLERFPEFIAFKPGDAGADDERDPTKPEVPLGSI